MSPSALADEIRAAVKQALREELPAILAELRAAPAVEDGNRLVDVEEAARRLGLSTSTVYKRAEACVLPSVKDGGRLLFRVADLRAYTAALRRSPERVERLSSG